MNKLGPLMIAIGLGHALVGIALFPDPLVAILREGIINTIQPPGYAAEPRFDRIAVFWFLIFSPVFSMLGQITSRAIAQGCPDILRVVGWNLLAMGVVGTAVLPISGNVTLVALAVLILKAASRVTATPLSTDV